MGHILILKEVDFQVNGIYLGGGGGGDTEVLEPLGHIDNAYVLDSNNTVTTYNGQLLYYYQVSAGDHIEFRTSNNSDQPVRARGGFFTSIPVLGSVATAFFDNGGQEHYVENDGRGSYDVLNDGYIAISGYAGAGLNELNVEVTATHSSEPEIILPSGGPMTAYVNQTNQQLTSFDTQIGYYYQVNAGDFVEFWITNSNNQAVWCRGGLFTSTPTVGATAVQPALNGPDGEHVATGGYGSITASENGYLYLCGFQAANFVVQVTR